MRLGRGSADNNNKNSMCKPAWQGGRVAQAPGPLNASPDRPLARYWGGLVAHRACIDLQLASKHPIWPPFCPIEATRLVQGGVGDPLDSQCPLLPPPLPRIGSPLTQQSPQRADGVGYSEIGGWWGCLETPSLEVLIASILDTMDTALWTL